MGSTGGLLLCINRNFNAIEVELDAKSIIDVLSTSNCSDILASPMVDDCRLLATEIHQIRFNTLLLRSEQDYWQAG